MVPGLYCSGVGVSPLLFEYRGEVDLTGTEELPDAVVYQGGGCTRDTAQDYKCILSLCDREVVLRVSKLSGV